MVSVGSARVLRGAGFVDRGRVVAGEWWAAAVVFRLRFGR